MTSKPYRQPLPFRPFIPARIERAPGFRSLTLPYLQLCCIIRECVNQTAVILINTRLPEGFCNGRKPISGELYAWGRPYVLDGH